MEDYYQDDFQWEEELYPSYPPPRKKKSKAPLIILIVCLTVLALAAAAFFLTAKGRKYDQAIQLYEDLEYVAAAQIFEELEDYKDAQKKAKDAHYLHAKSLLQQKEYAQALEVFSRLGDYEKADKWVLECHYNIANEAMEAKDYDAAIEGFTKAENYNDAPTRKQDAIYKRGHELFLDNEPEQAQAYFDQLNDAWPAGGGPHYVTFEEALEYIDARARDLPESVTVIVKDMPGSYILRTDLLLTTIQQHLGYQFASVSYNETSKALTVEASYYPGQKIVYAIETDDFSKLSGEEMETYEIAKDLVSRARAENPDPAAVELWLHDWLCENVEYDSPYEYVYPEDFVGLDELTCVGALRDGKANCQGYTDAFYLLGKMAGLDVCIMFGEAEGGGHCWNAVRLDGKLYMVDVTFDDTFYEEPDMWTYIWYNNVLDLDVYSVLGGSTLFPGLVTRNDTGKTYYAYTDNVYEDMGEAAYQLLRQYRYNGPCVCYAVVLEPDLTSDDFYTAVANNMDTAGVNSAQWYVDLFTYEGYTYMVVEWVEE